MYLYVLSFKCFFSERERERYRKRERERERGREREREKREQDREREREGGDRERQRETKKERDHRYGASEKSVDILNLFSNFNRGDTTRYMFVHGRIHD